MGFQPTLCKIVVLGDGGVGKTALVIQFALSNFVETYDPTIEDSYRKQIVVDGKTSVVEVLDTAGQEEYTALRDQWIRDGEAIFLVYSITSRSSFTRMRRFHSQVVRVRVAARADNPSIPLADMTGFPIILLGNKSDKNHEREVSLQEGLSMANELGCHFMECSAKNNASVDRVFEDTVRRLRQARAAQLQMQAINALSSLIVSPEPRVPHQSPPGSAWRRFGMSRTTWKFSKKSSSTSDLTKPINRRLLDASRLRDRKTVKQLLNQGADPTEQFEPDGCAIYAAAALGYADVLDLLLSRGAPPNPTGLRMVPPLQAAAIEGHREAVRFLLKKGSPVDERSDDHGTALIAAASRGRHDVVQILLRYRADPNARGGPYGNALQAAALFGNAPTASLLLDARANINARGHGDCTALQVACFAGHVDIFKLLVERGADVNASGGLHGTALHAAHEHGHWEIYKLLLGCGAHDRIIEPPQRSSNTVDDTEERHLKSAPNPSEMTYRVRGIPFDYSSSETQEMLERVLSVDHTPVGVKVRSLAEQPSWQTRLGKIATITLTHPPPCFFTGKTEWTFEVPSLEHTRPVSNRMRDETISMGRRLTVDTHFRGLTTLASFEDPAKHKIDCIAISGLGGHAFGSFKQRGGPHMWLRDSLPIDLPGARVMLYGYETNLHGSFSFQDLEMLASTLRLDLQSISTYEDIEQSGSVLKPIVFIAHSLGGLIVKEALIQMKEGMKSDKSILDATYGALFFGVPNTGMEIQSLIAMVKDQPNQGLLHSLCKGSQLLREQSKKFSKVFGEHDYEIVCFFETMMSPTAECKEGRWAMTGKPAILVDESSATDGRRWQREDDHVQAINRSHSDLVKFSYHDNDYDRVLGMLKKLTSAAITEIRYRSWAHS